MKPGRRLSRNLEHTESELFRLGARLPEVLHAIAEQVATEERYSDGNIETIVVRRLTSRRGAPSARENLEQMADAAELLYQTLTRIHLIADRVMTKQLADEDRSSMRCAGTGDYRGANCGQLADERRGDGRCIDCGQIADSLLVVAP